MEQELTHDKNVVSVQHGLAGSTLIQCLITGLTAEVLTKRSKKALRALSLSTLFEVLTKQCRFSPSYIFSSNVFSTFIE
jgi:hypothetical protein